MSILEAVQKLQDRRNSGYISECRIRISEIIPLISRREFRTNKIVLFSCPQEICHAMFFPKEHSVLNEHFHQIEAFRDTLSQHYSYSKKEKSVILARA